MNPEETQPINVEETSPAWLPERLERAKRGAIQALLDDLGFADPDSLKTALHSQAEQVTALAAERDHLTQQLEAAQNARQQAYLEAAFSTEAGRFRFINLDEAQALLDWRQVRLTEEGQVVGMAEALTALVQARPHLVRRQVAPQIDGKTQSVALPKPTHAAELPSEQVQDLKRRFRLG